MYLEEYTNNTLTRGFSFELLTPYDERKGFNLLHLKLYKHSWWFKIPEFIKPGVAKCSYSKTGFKDVQREYGISISGECCMIHYGIQPGDWIRDDPKNSDHVLIINWPWEYEHVRNTLFNLWLDPVMEGAAKRNLMEKSYQQPDHFSWIPEDIPNIFHFFDYIDVPRAKANPGEGQPKVVPAKAHVEEHEWIRGKWKWLRSIFKHFWFGRKVRRFLEVEFKHETGPRSGSWKGGTMACGIDMLPGESFFSALARFPEVELERSKRYINR